MNTKGEEKTDKNIKEKKVRIQRYNKIKRGILTIRILENTKSDSFYEIGCITHYDDFFFLDNPSKCTA